MLLLIPTTTTIKPIIDLCDVKCNQNNRLSVLITGLSVILLLISLLVCVLYIRRRNNNIANNANNRLQIEL
jgi:hypothetical protein